MRPSNLLLLATACCLAGCYYPELRPALQGGPPALRALEATSPERLLGEAHPATESDDPEVVRRALGVARFAATLDSEVWTDSADALATRLERRLDTLEVDALVEAGEIDLLVAWLARRPASGEAERARGELHRLVCVGVPGRLREREYRDFVERWPAAPCAGAVWEVWAEAAWRRLGDETSLAALDGWFGFFSGQLGAPGSHPLERSALRLIEWEVVRTECWRDADRCGGERGSASRRIADELFAAERRRIEAEVHRVLIELVAGEFDYADGYKGPDPVVTVHYRKQLLTATAKLSDLDRRKEYELYAEAVFDFQLSHLITFKVTDIDLLEDDQIGSVRLPKDKIEAALSRGEAWDGKVQIRRAATIWFRLSKSTRALYSSNTKVARAPLADLSGWDLAYLAAASLTAIHALDNDAVAECLQEHVEGQLASAGAEHLRADEPELVRDLAAASAAEAYGQMRRGEVDLGEGATDTAKGVFVSQVERRLDDLQDGLGQIVHTVDVASCLDEG